MRAPSRSRQPTSDLPASNNQLMWRRAINRVRAPRLGLALSGGAARGVAHVGVLKVFREHGIPVDCVAGTSAGALVGGAFASGMSVEELEEIGRRLRWRGFGRMTPPRLGAQRSGERRV